MRKAVRGDIFNIQVPSSSSGAYYFWNLYDDEYDDEDALNYDEWHFYLIKLAEDFGLGRRW